jgi:GH15 family glucan-1,4-alpha-glucosidase
LLCRFWLAEAQALADQVDRARNEFEMVAGFANDLGLLAEEAGPETGELAVNLWQCFIHIGFVNAGAISEAERPAHS